jgi:hypothetical protein
MIKRDTLEELIEQQRSLDEDRLSFRSHGMSSFHSKGIVSFPP